MKSGNNPKCDAQACWKPARTCTKCVSIFTMLKKLKNKAEKTSVAWGIYGCSADTSCRDEHPVGITWCQLINIHDVDVAGWYAHPQIVACRSDARLVNINYFDMEDIQHIIRPCKYYLLNNNNSNKCLYSVCSTECAHRRFTVHYYYYPWSIDLETIVYHHSPSAKHTSPAAYMALVDLFNCTISFTASPGSTHR